MHETVFEKNWCWCYKANFITYFDLTALPTKVSCFQSRTIVQLHYKFGKFRNHLAVEYLSFVFWLCISCVFGGY